MKAGNHPMPASPRVRTDREAGVGEQIPEPVMGKEDPRFFELMNFRFNLFSK